MLQEACDEVRFVCDSGATGQVSCIKRFSGKAQRMGAGVAGSTTHLESPAGVRKPLHDFRHLGISVGCARRLALCRLTAAWSQSSWLEQGDDLGVGQGGRRLGAADTAPGEGNDGVGMVGVGQMVGGEEHRAAGIGLGTHHLEDAALGCNVETRRRFIEQEDRRLLNEALGDERSLPLTTGQLVDRSTSQLEEPDSVERLVNGPPVAALERAQKTSSPIPPHPHHVVDRESELGIDGGCLHHVGHRSAGRDRSRRRSHPTADEGEHRRLACTVRADDRSDRALLEGQGHRTECGGSVVVGVDVAESDGRLCITSAVGRAIRRRRVVLVATTHDGRLPVKENESQSQDGRRVS